MSLVNLDIDQWIILIFLAITLIVGIVSGLKIKTVKDYTIGEKGSFPTSILAMTLIATMIGGNGTIGSVAEFYKHGYIFATIEIGCIIGLLLVAKFVASKFDHRFNGMFSSADIIGKFYGERAEKFTGIIASIFGVCVLGAQITALASVYSGFMGADYAASVVIVGGVLIFYSTFGGIRSVAITDAIQFLLLAVGIPIIANLCFQEVGNFNIMVASLPEGHTDIIEKEDFAEHTAVALLHMLPFLALHPSLIQRYLMAENATQISKITYLYVFLGASISLMAAYIAFSALALFPNIEPNSVLPKAINTLLPIGLKGIAMTGMIAVIMSTADSYLNTTGILLTLNTFFARNISDRKKLALMKVNTLIIGGLAIVIALQQIPIFHVIVTANVLLTTTTIPLFMKIVGLDVKAGQFWGNVFTGAISFIVVKFGYGLDMKICLFISAISAMIAFILTHLIQNGLHFKYDNTKTKGREDKVWSFFSFNNCVPTLAKLAKYSSEKVRDVGAPYHLFGIFCCVNYVVPYFMWSFDKFPNQEIITLIRFIAGGLCVFLIMADQWHRKIEKYLPLYWHFTVMFCLPFVTTVMFFATQAQYGWLLNMALATFFLSVIVDWRTFLTLNMIGIISGTIFHEVFIGKIVLNLDTRTIYLMIYTFIFSTFIGVLFARRREVLGHEKVQIMQMFAGIVAHELRTPLANCKMAVDTLKSIFSPSSLSKDKKGDYVLRLTKQDYEMINLMQKQIAISVASGNKAIDMTLMASKTAVVAEDKKCHSMKKTVAQALDGMVLSDEDRGEIITNLEDDFQYYGSKDYMIHVIWNLVTNAFKYGVVGKQEAKISISIIGDELWVRDTGNGINKKEISKIFDRFYTKSSTGTGIGLAFCKMVVEDCEGTITCHSTVGEYTTFIIKIPQR